MHILLGERERDQVSEWLLSKLCGSDSKSKRISEKAKKSLQVGTKVSSRRLDLKEVLEEAENLERGQGRMELSTFQPNKGQSEDSETRGLGLRRKQLTKNESKFIILRNV